LVFGVFSRVGTTGILTKSGSLGIVIDAFCAQIEFNLFGMRAEYHEFRIVLLASLLTGFFFSCNQKGNALKNQLATAIQTHAADKTVLEMQTLTDFDWERMYFLDSDSGMQEDQVSSIICGEGWSLGQNTKVVFFMVGRDVVCHFEIVDRDPIDLYIYPCLDGLDDECYPYYAVPSTAKYRIVVDDHYPNGHVLYELRCASSAKTHHNSHSDLSQPKAAIQGNDLHINPIESSALNLDSILYQLKLAHPGNTEERVALSIQTDEKGLYISHNYRTENDPALMKIVDSIVPAIRFPVQDSTWHSLVLNFEAGK
jgi:hypothetical protein